MTRLQQDGKQNIEIYGVIFIYIEICRVMFFYVTVDNFVDKHLRVLDVARKECLNGRLANRGSFVLCSRVPCKNK